MHNDVILSDGDVCHVRVLGLFELDEEVPLPQIGRFTYKIHMLPGDVYEAEFKIEDFKTPPIKPDIPESEIVEKSAAWYDLRTWQLYQAALLHEKRRTAALIQYKNDTLDYILRECLDPKDVRRLRTKEDWEKIHDAAVIEPVTYELLAEVLRTTFHATFADQEVFDAFEIISGGLSSYDAIKKWENDLMLAMRMSEVEYVMLSPKERARKICALHLDDWLGALQSEVDRKKAEAEAARSGKGAKFKQNG